MFCINSFQEVDLSGNNLTYLHENVTRLLLSDGRRVNLTGNELDCGCEHAAALTLLRERAGQVAGYGALRCAGGGPVRGAALRHCAEWTPLALGAALLLVALLAAAAVAYRCYGRTLRSVLYARGCCVAPDDEDDDKTYDVFVSHAHEDEDFVVSALAPRLEARGLSLCLHFRDWVVGEPIPDQIARSVSRSRRTLIVLSPHFAKSHWGHLEFNAARERALEDRRRRLVLVVLEEPTAPLDEELARYLRTNTYVKWGDPWFWDKLLYALPHRRAPSAAADLAPLSRRLAFSDRLRLTSAPALATVLTADNKLMNAADDKRFYASDNRLITEIENELEKGIDNASSTADGSNRIARADKIMNDENNKITKNAKNKLKEYVADKLVTLDDSKMITTVNNK